MAAYVARGVSILLCESLHDFCCIDHTSLWEILLGVVEPGLCSRLGKLYSGATA